MIIYLMNNNGYKIEVFHDEMLCKLYAPSNISYESTLEIINLLSNHPERKPEYKIIVYSTNVNTHFRFNELMTVIETFRKNKSMLKGKVAMVVSEMHQISGDLISAHMKLVNVKMKFFNSEEKAINWINS